MMISKPFATIESKKGAGTEMCLAIVTGEAPVWRRSALTVPEAFTKANSAQFPSCHGAHASVSSFGSGINFAAIGSESQMFVRT